MNKIKILLITIILILLAVGVLYGIRMSVQIQPTPEIETEQLVEVASTSANYASETGDEARVIYYSDNTADLHLIGTEYSQVKFTMATSASGARYENTELGLVLWEKEPNLTIYKDDESIFAGRKFEVLAQEQIQKNLTQYSWVWIETIEGERTALDPKRIIPKNPESFSLTFTLDGKVSGTTDCNNFSGTYLLEENKIKFGNFMSTLMYCEGSQEQEFISMIKDGTIKMNQDNFEIITDSTSVLFSKKQE